MTPSFPSKLVFNLPSRKEAQKAQEKQPKNVFVPFVLFCGFLL
jgi:hypothetical protein